MILAVSSILQWGSRVLLLALPVLLLACESRRGDQALGTLEWDRIELVATAAEPVVSIDVAGGPAPEQGRPDVTT